VGYIGYQIYKFQKPPILTVSQPANEYISDQETVLLKGITDLSTVVSVNDQQVDINDDGEFEKELSLSKGVNTINVKASKGSNSKLQTTVTLKVIYTPKDENTTQQETKEFTLLLTVSQSPSWIKLDVDGQNKISQVLQPNTQHEYKILNNFTLVTGRVQNTSLTVNGENITVSSSSATGIGQVSCKIESNELKCE
jgi:hypothetical protein